MDYCLDLNALIQKQERDIPGLEAERHFQDSNVPVELINKSKAARIIYRKCALKKRRGGGKLPLVLFYVAWAAAREGQMGSNGRKNILE